MDKLRITQLKSLDDHFREVTKMVVLGSGAKREITENINSVVPINTIQ